MFAFTEAVAIAAPVERVWAALQDLESWWPSSNPEHGSIERLDSRGNEVGARLRIREKIAGIPGEAEGVITTVVPGSEVTWESDQARYCWLGMSMTVGEGVTWRVAPAGRKASTLSAHVWATFPTTIRGRLLAWAFVHLLGGESKDRAHARAELDYLKAAIERGAL